MVAPTNEQLASEVEGVTFATLFLDAVREVGTKVALRTVGEASVEYTYAEYADRVARIAAGLQARGLKRGQRVVLMFRNIPEFHFIDTAITFCGATPISIYNSSSPEQIAFLAGHSEARMAIVEDEAFVAAVREASASLPKLRSIGVLRGEADFSVEGLLAHAPIDLDVAASNVHPTDLATVIYTSGTTGPPKGVMITQRNLAYTVAMMKHAGLKADPEFLGSRIVSYLPMAHIAERLTTHYGGISGRYEVTCLAEMAQLAPTLRAVRPNVMLGVPRVWEKLQAGLLAALSADPATLEQFEKGMAAAAPIALAKSLGQATDADLATLAFLDEVGFAPLRVLLGLDDLRIAVSSAAPIAPGLVTWFRALGLPLSELYGLSETSGPMTWDGVHPKPGTVGHAIAGCEVRLDVDGEILCRGGNIFAGYLKDPAKTAEVMDADGWLHTGDIGRFDADGYLQVIDRKKELIITAGGKNISPANLEAEMKMIPMVGQACAIGDGKPFMSALLVLDPDQARAFAVHEGLTDDSLAAIATNEKVAAIVAEGMQEAMSDFNHAEQIKRWVILGVDWLPDSDELTPTSKLKRRNVATKYAAEIASMYD